MYYVVNVKKEGPYSVEELASKKMTGDVYVWKEGMTAWSNITELEEFKVQAASATPPPLTVNVKKETVVHTHHKSTEEVHKNSAATYFIFADNKTDGPYNIEDLTTKKIDGDTLVWKQGMTSWLKASELEELHEHTAIKAKIEHHRKKEASYFIKKGEKQEGPYTIQALTDLGHFSHDTLVWKEGGTTWQKISEADELSHLVKKTHHVHETAGKEIIIDIVEKEIIKENGAHK